MAILSLAMVALVAANVVDFNGVAAAAVTPTSTVTPTPTVTMTPTLTPTASPADTPIPTTTPSPAPSRVPPALELVQSVGPDLVTTGSLVTYTLSYGNTGGGSATGVTLRNTLDSNVGFVSASITPATRVGSTLYWYLCELGPSASSEIVISATVPCGLRLNTVLTNSATLDSAQTVPVTVDETAVVSGVGPRCVTPTPTPTITPLPTNTPGSSRNDDDDEETPTSSPTDPTPTKEEDPTPTPERTTPAPVLDTDLEPEASKTPESGNGG
jgi:uncharacterized repeat protein (TIGR01451 family)